MSDNRPNNHVPALYFAHSFVLFENWLWPLWGKRHIYNMQWRAADVQLKTRLLSVSERRVKIPCALKTSHFCSFCYQLNLWAHCQHPFLWLLFAPNGVNVSEWRAAGSQAQVCQVDGCGAHVQPVNHRRPGWNLCAHKNTKIRERNDKNSCMSLLHSHVLPIFFNATIYEPLCSCTIFKTLTVFFPFFPLNNVNAWNVN